MSMENHGISIRGCCCIIGRERRGGGEQYFNKYDARRINRTVCFNDISLTHVQTRFLPRNGSNEQCTTE